MTDSTRETAPDLIADKDGSWRIGEVRREVAIEAAYEIEQLARLLKTMCPDGLVESHYALRGLFVRFAELSSVVMAALGDELEPTTEIEARLRG